MKGLNRRITIPGKKTIELSFRSHKKTKTQYKINAIIFGKRKANSEDPKIP
jgi:hypothetical protein